MDIWGLLFLAEQSRSRIIPDDIMSHDAPLMMTVTYANCLTGKEWVNLPEVMTSSTVKPTSWARKPIMENTTKPANRLVPHVTRGMKRLSLQGYSPVMSHECHDVLDHRQGKCLFNSILTKEMSRFHISGLFGGKSTGNRWITLTKNQLCVKSVSWCHHESNRLRPRGWDLVKPRITNMHVVLLQWKVNTQITKETNGLPTSDLSKTQFI